MPVSGAICWGVVFFGWVIVLCAIHSQSADMNLAETANWESFAVYACPYNCSNRGVCNPDTQACTCSAGFGGIGCQYGYHTLAKGVPFQGNLTEGTQWVYFNYTPGANDNILQFQLNTTQQNATAQLYAKFVGNAALSTSWPRTDYYDYKDLTDDLSENITIYAPKIGLWLVGIFNQHSALIDFNISASSSVQCPNNCSNSNGVCNQAGVCVCNQNYTLLPDCSQYSAKLPNNVWMGLTLQPGQWAFYVFQVVNQNEINVTLNETTPGSQSVLLRLYASSTTYPTLYSYTYMASVATQSLQIQNATNGFYYFGVYFPVTPTWMKPASFELQAQAYVACPNYCSGQGTCQMNPLGVCQCNPNHNLPDCSQIEVAMNNATLYTDQLTKGDWAFYKLAVSSQNQIVVTATEQVSSGSLALYGREGLQPDLYHYDVLAIPAAGAVHTLRIINPTGNVPFYLGVYAITDLKYQIQSISTISCPNDCSGHGVCVNGVCNCSTNWAALADCSQFNVIMSNGQNYTHDISVGMTHYYQIYVVSANQLVFDVNSTDPNAPLFVYAQYATVPTFYSYQAISNSTEPFHRIEIDGLAAAQEGMWYVAVFNSGNSTTSYSIQGFALRVCPNECSGNGQCQGGICNCKPSYTNYDCSSEEIEIASSIEVSGVVHAAQWNFYHIDVLSTNALHVKVTELSTVGKVWLYMLKGDGGETFPTQTRHTYANKSDTSVHEIFVPSVNSSGTWYIGCFGSPYLGFSEPQAEYSVIALVGCNDYKRCDSCIQDPNCGWCADDALNPENGFCTSGTAEKPFNNKCVAWLFTGCNVKKVQAQSALIGVVIGISVGGGVGLILLALAFIIYKRRSYYLKKNAYSPFDVTIISDDEDNAEEYLGGSSSKPVEEEEPKGWKGGLSSLFHNMSSSFGKLPELDSTDSDHKKGKAPSRYGNIVDDEHEEEKANGSRLQEERESKRYSTYLGRRLDEEGFISDRVLGQEKRKEKEKLNEKEKQGERGTQEHLGEDNELPREGESKPLNFQESEETKPTGKSIGAINSGDDAGNKRTSRYNSVTWFGQVPTTTTNQSSMPQLPTNKESRRTSWLPSWRELVSPAQPPPVDPSRSSAYESIGDSGYHSE